MTKVFKKESDVAWENHFMVDGAKLQWLYTKEKDESPITVMKVLLQKGVTLPDHRHPDQPDLIYPLKGKATMFIEGEGEFPLEPGMVVQVPQNALHAIRRVEEELCSTMSLPPERLTGRGKREKAFADPVRPGEGSEPSPGRLTGLVTEGFQGRHHRLAALVADDAEEVPGFFCSRGPFPLTRNVAYL